MTPTTASLALADDLDAAPMANDNHKRLVKTGAILGEETEGVNQILPHRNKWAWELYLTGAANNWMPNEVPMIKDLQSWKSKDVLSDDERLVIKRCLGFFAGSESLVSNNLMALGQMDYRSGMPPIYGAPDVRRMPAQSHHRLHLRCAGSWMSPKFMKPMPPFRRSRPRMIS